MTTYKPTKYKGLAIALAVFFGPFAWIYTWKYDNWKFWVGLMITTAIGWLILPLPFIWAWPVIDMIIKPQKAFDDYYKK